VVIKQNPRLSFYAILSNRFYEVLATIDWYGGVLHAMDQISREEILAKMHQHFDNMVANS